MEPFPFLLKPSGKDHIWGGTRLRDEFHKDCGMTPLAETWECSTHPDGPCHVASGPAEGLSLADLLQRHSEYLGTSLQGRTDLPVLIKFIDAHDNLSVQVHPDDGFAQAEEWGQSGKTEMWYVVDAAPGAELVFGLSRRMSREALRRSVVSGMLERYLNRVPVHRNDVFYIPSGTIHAIGKGALIAEIQQSSNLTYRLYDYNRRGKDGQLRELHIDKALAVSRTDGLQEPRQPIRVLHYTPGFASEMLCQCPSFQVFRCLLKTDGVPFPALPESFRSVLCVEGEGCLSGCGGSLRFTRGDSVFVPATCGPMTLAGDASFLLTRC